MAKCLNEVIQNCSEGDELICTDVHPLNNTYLTENKSYTVTVDGDGDLCIIDDEGDLDDVLVDCVEGDTITCIAPSTIHFTLKVNSIK